MKQIDKDKLRHIWCKVNYDSNDLIYKQVCHKATNQVHMQVTIKILVNTADFERNIVDI